MSEITIFAFDSSAVRTLSLNGDPWFVATDIAKILGYKLASDMCKMLDDDEKGMHNVHTPSSNQYGYVGEQATEVTIINESGLYAAILKSRRPEAKAFRKWVTSEVLPAIRKHGGYAVPGDGAGAAPQFVTGNLSHGADLAVAADRTFRSFLRAARSAGLALPQALRMANQKTMERTGMDMLAEMGIDPGVESPSGINATSEPPEEDPLWTALVQWSSTIGTGEVFTMADILLKVCGIKQSEKAFKRVSCRAGPMLRRCGFSNRKTRYNGKVIMLWTKR